jgi:hypothetical protein
MVVRSSLLLADLVGAGAGAGAGAVAEGGNAGGGCSRWL